MINRVLAGQALELRSCTITDIITEAHSTSVDVVIGRNWSREGLLAQAGKDVLTLAPVMRLYRCRAVPTPSVDGAAGGE